VDSNLRKGRVGVMTTYAAKGEIKATLKAAEEIVPSRYRAVALCNTARKLAERGDIEFARMALTNAETNMSVI